MTMGMVLVALRAASNRLRRIRDDHVDICANGSAASEASRSGWPSAKRASNVMFCPSLQPSSCSPLFERAEAALPFRIVCRQSLQQSDPPHAVALLHPCRKRPRCGSGEDRDECAPVHVWMAPAWQEKM